MIRFVVAQHLSAVAVAMGLFFVGLALSFPAVRWRATWLVEPPLAIFRFILGVMGPAPSLLRMAAAIFAWNSLAIFVYMASGWHPALPAAFSLLTGMNVGIVTMVGSSDERMAERMVSARKDHWRPPALLAGICGLLVPLLELPAFWFAIAMGMSMGRAVQAGETGYLAALAPRARAYAGVLLPVLLISAVAEAVAIRTGATRRAEAQTRDE